MSTLLRPWSEIEKDIEAEMASRLRELRFAQQPDNFRFIQGELAGLERALEIARREPRARPSAADDNLYPV